MPPEKPARADMFIPADHPTFQRVASGGHPDLLVIERQMDERKGQLKNGIEVEEARKIAPFLRLTASSAGWRVVIVDDADTMNRNAQNALLKILEEPPPRSVLILIAHRTGAFLPTIRSRARLIRFDGLPPRAFSGLMRTAYPRASVPDMDRLALICAGAPGRAARLYEAGGLQILDQFLSVCADLPALDRLALARFAEGFTGPEGETRFLILRDLIGWVLPALTRARARGGALPPFLAETGLARVSAAHSLEEWLRICDTLTDALAEAVRASLDRRLVLLTGFRTLARAA